MTADPRRRITNRRHIVASLREMADTMEREVLDLRERADRLEASTDRLERGEIPG